MQLHDSIHDIFGHFSIGRPFTTRYEGNFGFRMDGNTFTENGNEIWRTFSPRLALALQLDPIARWTLNASVGRYFKIPPYTVLGFQDNAGNFLNQDAEYIEKGFH